MRVGIGLPNQVRDVRATVIPEWARQAEAAGFSSLGSTGRYAYPGIMDTVALAAAAGATSSIGLVSTVLVAPAWPPAILAKETAGINEISGGRLTLGIGIGGRADDFMVDGLGMHGRGERLDRDIALYEDIWSGKKPEDAAAAAVPLGTRPVPLLFGGYAPAAFRRMARHGQGYVGSVSPERVEPAFESARSAWRDAGRSGSPRLVAATYFAVDDADTARGNVWDYYHASGSDIADRVANSLAVGARAIRATRDAYEAVGTDELIFVPATDSIDQVSRLANIAL